MRKGLALVVLAVSLFSASAQAVPVQATLTDVTNYIGGGSWTAVTSGDASWAYDTDTGVVTGTGTFTGDFYAGPGPSLFFSHTIEDLVVGGGGSAGATSFICDEGVLAGFFGGNACGNYAFGTNGYSESSYSYGPGTAFSRTIGGDDIIEADQHNLAFWDGMTSTLNGTTLTLTNNTGLNSQYVPQFSMTFEVNVVPVPAAVWLFGSGLGLLGWIRRRQTA